MHVQLLESLQSTLRGRSQVHPAPLWNRRPPRTLTKPHTKVFTRPRHAHLWTGVPRAPSTKPHNKVFARLRHPRTHALDTVPVAACNSQPSTFRAHSSRICPGYPHNQNQLSSPSASATLLSELDKAIDCVRSALQLPSSRAQDLALLGRALLLPEELMAVVDRRAVLPDLQRGSTKVRMS